MPSSVVIFSLICAVVGLTDSYKILAIFPVPSISHQVVFRPLMHELAKRGHEVVVMTPNPAFPKGKCPQNLTEIDVHEVSYNIYNNMIRSGKMIQGNTPAMQAKIIFDMMIEIFEAQMNSKDVQNLLNNKEKNFDLLFTEACYRPALSLAYIYRVPVIEFSSLGGLWGTYETIGAPTNPLVYPLSFHQRVYNLSIWEKLFQLYEAYAIDTVIKEHEKIQNKVLRRIFDQNMPDVSDLINNIQMIFLNVHSLWDFNRPVPPNVIYLGGMHKNTPKELPQDIKNYLDSSENDIIYVSFGTNARPSLLPIEKLRIFKSVFCQLPYDILLKWDEDDLEGRCENVRISKWYPQSDLLNHPKVKLFITQGGLQSTDEALKAGVPLIAIPFLGDQWFNAEKYEKLNIGIHINMEDLTEDTLKNAIERIIHDQTYRNNVEKLYKLMQDQPQSSLERAVWWTEYVLRNGGAAHLHAAAARMPWTEYYALDLILLVLSIFVTVVACIIFAISFFMSTLRQNTLRIKVKTK